MRNSTSIRESNTASSSSQPTHHCGICRKGFDRRDLRDRHKKRCIQSFSKPRKSKRRSCHACAASKLGCDLDYPQCTRCVNRNISCEYPAHITDGQDHHTQSFSNGLTDVILDVHNEDADTNQSEGSQRGSHLGNVPLNLDTSPFGLNMVEMRALFTNQLTAGSTRGPESVSEDGEINGSSQNKSVLSQLANNNGWIQPMDWSPSMVLPPNSSETTNRTKRTTHSRTTTASIASEIESLDNTVPVNWAMTQDEVLDGMQNQAWVDNLLSNNAADSPNDHAFDLLGSFGMPSASGPISRNDQTGNPSTFQPVLWKPPLPFENESFQANPMQHHPSMSTSVSPREKEDGRSATKRKSSKDKSQPVQRLRHESNVEKSPSSECPFHKVGTDDKLVELLVSYIQTMLHKGRYPPFVHSKLYKCVEGDVLESLANAFCSLAAHNASLPSSQEFVNLMMNTERSRLVKSFRSTGKSDVEGLAALHSVSLYQVVGLFDSTAEQARLSELQQSFFLKMARRLAQQFLSSTPDAVSDSPDTKWRKWILLESLRRSLLLVNIINNLGCRTQKLNGFYYEPLGDDLVMNMPLPALECLWNAKSADEWLSKLENLSEMDQLIMTTTIGKLKAMVDPAVASQSPAPKIGFDQLSEFTRLVMASLIVELPED